MVCDGTKLNRKRGFGPIGNATLCSTLLAGREFSAQKKAANLDGRGCFNERRGQDSNLRRGVTPSPI